ncbi:NAD(P)/FAD-dependent oxidoreductase [Acidimicrobiia bacterium EGI L10123]|uniref:phytoene desaturase family protein n=1 Tax=Salinilacustrithrix flava TaxID=2957203 RepID=UPI003D7C2939|nr:NAD(P)/FAD-dependent oxidoreductase [Acidimicrobiia bacterium EGI L10123]
MDEQRDAIIVGAGPNGLTAANLLADRGWRVLVLEAQPEPGGAVRSAATMEDGFITDRFSAFYPLGAVSPVLADLGLEHHGLEWGHAPAVLANPTPDGPALVLSRDRAVTARSLDAFAAGDGDRWRELQDRWEHVEDALMDAFMRPFPPVRHGLRLLARLGVRGAGELVRTGLLPVRRFAQEHFDGDGGALLIGGCGLHADMTPESAASGFFGWMLAGIGQSRGWPVPRGGSGALTEALVRRLTAAGGELRCDAPVERIVVDDDRAAGVVVDGTVLRARRGVLADVVAPTLYESLLPERAVPPQVHDDMARYQRGAATFKVNWTLDGAVPWRDPAVRGAGTVHLAGSLDELTYSSAMLACGRIPADPFLLIGQMTTADPSRSPAGTESLWAYTSVPQGVRSDEGDDRLDGSWDHDQNRRFADRIEARIERDAPGFRGLIRAREIQSPRSLQADDANLLLGDKSLGTAQLHQQLVFRPRVGMGRPETAVPGLYLASASAHPGGGVHGACGANAASAAVAHDRVRRLTSRLRG